VSPPTPSPPQPAAEDKSQRIKRFFAEIQAAAKAKDFARAEELREKLIKIDPMALREIITASVFI
jgi:excinuclease UvrABC helicase subunit UvrB